MDTLSELKELLQAVMTDADLSAVEITPATRLVADLGMNSIHMILCAFSIQEKYGAELDGLTVNGNSTVGDILEFIGANRTK